MELLKHLEQRQTFSREQAEPTVYDIVTELLSISLEKFDMEVIIDSDNSWIDKGNYHHIPRSMKTEIEFEDILETPDKLELTLSGEIKGSSSYRQAFMLFFSIHRNQQASDILQNNTGMGDGENSLYLQFYKKAEQLSDPVFRVNWAHEDAIGNTCTLGQGKGILVFARDQQLQVN